MPEFVKPFTGTVPDRKLTPSELARAIRLNIAAELEAVHLYTAHADATDNELARKVLLDVADEERVHAGEFQRLLSILLPDEDRLMAKGAAEVNAMAAGTPTGVAGATVSSGGNGGASANIPTIGSMRR